MRATPAYHAVVSLMFAIAAYGSWRGAFAVFHAAWEQRAAVGAIMRLFIFLPLVALSVLFLCLSLSMAWSAFLAH